MRRLLTLLTGAAFLAVLPGVATAVAAGAQSIAVVIDFGNGSKPQVLCAAVPGGISDLQALTTALSQANEAAPTFASSGLLCSINNFPTTGCGPGADSHYAYWAYFHGTASGWSYAHNGPAEQAASTQIAQGWRFEVNGSGGSSDMAPSASSSASQLCPDVSAAAALPATVTPPPTVPEGGATVGQSVTTPTTGLVATPPASRKASSPTTDKNGASVAAPARASGAPQTSGASSPWPVLVALGVSVLAVGGVIVAKRRRPS